MSVTLYRRGFDSSISSDFQVLDSLQRQYRAIEYARRDQTNDDSANTVFRVQKHLIDKLKRDRDRLKTELSIETRQARIINNHYEAAQIVRLQDQGDLYSKLIESEKRKIDEAEKLAAKLQRAIASLRKETGGINAARESNAATQKQIKILENRLDKALVKLNESLANNKNLRFSIDNLRRERFVFDGIYKKLERELADKKGKMNEIMNFSQLAYQQKQAAEEDLLSMKQKAENEQNAFENKWNELGQLIQEDRQMKLNLRAKEQFRALKLFGQTAAESTWSSHIDDEHRMKKKINKLRSAIDESRDSIAAAQLRVEEFETAFQQIQSATSIVDIEELVKVFVNAEDNNFGLFNFVNELSNQITQYEESIGKFEREIASFHMNSAPAQLQDHQRNAMLSELASQLNSTEQSTNQFQLKYQSSLKLIQNLKEGIVKIYQQLNCNQMESHQKLVELFGNLQVANEADSLAQAEADAESGNSAAGDEKSSAVNSSMNKIPQYYGLTETNLLKYLGMIEVRTNELLKKYVKSREEEHVEEFGIETENREIIELEEKIRLIQEEINSEEQFDELEEEEEDELRKQALQLNLTDPQELRKKMAGSKYYRRKSSIAGAPNEKLDLAQLKQLKKNASSATDEQLFDEANDNGRESEETSKQAESAADEEEYAANEDFEAEEESATQSTSAAQPTLAASESASADASSSDPAPLNSTDSGVPTESPRSPEPLVVSDSMAEEQRM